MYFFCVLAAACFLLIFLKCYDDGNDDDEDDDNDVNYSIGNIQCHIRLGLQYSDSKIPYIA